MNSAARFGLLAIMTVAVAGGCSCEDTRSADRVTVQFVSPEHGATLRCADDVDHEGSHDVIDTNVEVEVDLVGNAARDYSVRLRIDGDDASTTDGEIDSNGVVRFLRYALSNGEVVLVVEVLEGEEIIASAERPILVEYDEDDPDCAPDIEPTSITFVSPTGTLGAADDGDGTLSNGLQVDVVLAIEGSASGPVTLVVDDVEAGEADFGADNMATFRGVTLSIGSGQNSVELVATVASAAGEARAELVVDIAIDACTLTFDPPAGCVGGDQDADPEAAGVQIELSAETNCAEVTFIVNGMETTVAAMNGRSAAQITLDDGANTVQARASNPGGLGALSDERELAASSTVPTAALELDSMGDNLLGLADGEAGDDGATWTLSGSTTGVAEGATVALAFDPALDGAPATADVGADGSFSFAVTASWYRGAVQVTATDTCGAVSRSPAYELTLDAVVPTLTLVAPENPTVTIGDDVDADRDGVQFDFVVQVDDPRPDVAEFDYAITVQCTDAPPAFEGRYTADPDLDGQQRGDLVDGVGNLRATFPLVENGVLSCRAYAEVGPNLPDSPAIEVTLAFLAPTFTITDPRQPPGGIECLSGEVVVGGNGVGLEGAALTATVSDGDQEVMAPLEAEGGGQFAVRFGAGGDGPDALDDGRYTATVAGVGLGGAEVAVVPAGGVEFIVDNSAPTVELRAPAVDAPIGIDGDANGDLADCVQTELLLGLSDATASRVCYTLGGGVRRCGLVDVEGLFVVPQVTLLDGDNQLVLTSEDCAGNEAREVIVITTEGCAPRIEITDPPDGSTLALAADLDPIAAGLQINVTVDSALPQGTQIEVVVDGDQVYGPVVTDADGDAVVPVTVLLPDAPGGDHPFTLQPRTVARDAVGPVNNLVVVFAVPELTIDPVGGPCVNAAHPDASVEEGFQIALTATTETLEEGTRVNLAANCGAGPLASVGTVAADGSVAFAPLRVVREGTCQLTATAMDAAGQVARGELELVVDRVPPTFQMLFPEDGSEVGPLQDLDQRELAEANGIQVIVRARVCGAPGQTLNLTSDPELMGTGDFVLDAERDCADVALPIQTLELGDLRFEGRVTDACGNAVVGVSSATVDSDPNILVISPDDNADVNAAADLDEAEGCQIQLVAIATGFGAAAEFTVCTDVDTGAVDPACPGQWSAVGADGCELFGEVGTSLQCDLDLSEGVHTLTAVGVFGERVEATPLTVRVDCAPPTVESLTIQEDVNDDGCLNRHERADPGRVANTSAFSVLVETTGIDDGGRVQLRRDPGGAVVGNIEIEGGAGRFDIPQSGAGEFSYWIAGADAVGNALPAPGEPGVVMRPLKLDPFTPAPLLLNVAAASCLGIAADADGDVGGLQYQVDAQPRGEVGETFTARLFIDGALAQERAVETDQFLFDVTTIPEGARELALTVVDDCGNAGSAAGFFQADGLDDWDNPRSVDFVVDTVAPTMTLGGLQALYVEADDANDDAADGFQTDVTVDFDPFDSIESGQRVRIYSGENTVPTAAQIRVPGGLAGPIPARITLGPGAHSLTARASDRCRNPGVSPAVDVTVNIAGCASVVTTFPDVATTIGPDAGEPDGVLRLFVDLAATVDLFNPDCVGANTQAVVNNVPAGPIVRVPANGQVALPRVPLPRGENDVALRVTFAGGQTESPEKTVTVDLGTPIVAITSPAGPEPVLVLNDSDGVAPGQQTTVVVEVREDMVDSARTATLELDDVEVRQLAVGPGSPVLVSFTGVTVPAGVSTLRVCVEDLAGSEGCDEVQINADAGRPTALGDLTPTIVDPRSTEVDFAFTAPFDDGDSGGPVVRYEIRRAATAINTNGDWDNAELVDSVDFDALVHAAPGTLETLTVEDLRLNQRHFVSVRGVDDAGLLSPLNSVEVDLRFDQYTWDFTASVASGGPNWTGNFWGGPKSIIQRVGDVDDDGYADLLFAGTRDTGASRVTLIFGAADPADADTRELALPAGVAAAYFGQDADGVGDVNGDGAPDVAVMGFAGDFSFTGVGLYFGTPGCVHDGGPATAACRDAIAAVSSLIRTPGRITLSVNGIGNFNHLPGDGATPYDDVLVGGDAFNNDRIAFVVAGRATMSWPAVINLAVGGLDRANGITAIEVPETRVALYAASAGDADGDNYDELVFSAGGAINDSYRFNGGLNLPETYTYAAANPLTVKLVSPCVAAPNGFGTGFVGGVQLDGEGGPDFVISDRDSKRLIVFNQALQSTDCFGRGERAFGSRFDEIGDIDGDGAIDLVVSHDNADEASTAAYLFYNDGFGRFGINDSESPRAANAVLDTPAAKKIGITSAGDFTNNGLVDIAAAVKGPGAAAPAQVVLYYTEAD